MKNEIILTCFAIVCRVVGTVVLSTINGIAVVEELIFFNDSDARMTDYEIDRAYIAVRKYREKHRNE